MTTPEHGLGSHVYIRSFCDSRTCDYISLSAELDHYMLQNNATPAVKKHRIRLAIEETVWQLLLPHLETPYIRLRVEYSRQDGHCLVTVNYTGKPFDIRDSENKLSLSVLESTADSISYHYDDDKEKGNTIEIHISEKGVDYE